MHNGACASDEPDETILCCSSVPEHGKELPENEDVLDGSVSLCEPIIKENEEGSDEVLEVYGDCWYEGIGGSHTNGCGWSKYCCMDDLGGDGLAQITCDNLSENFCDDSIQGTIKSGKKYDKFTCEDGYHLEGCECVSDCGSANGTTRRTEPLASMLCAGSSVASEVEETSTGWEWSCSYGSMDTQCSAIKRVISPSCGTSLDKKCDSGTLSGSSNTKWECVSGDETVCCTRSCTTSGGGSSTTTYSCPQYYKMGDDGKCHLYAQFCADDIVCTNDLWAMYGCSYDELVGDDNLSNKGCGSNSCFGDSKQKADGNLCARPNSLEYEEYASTHYLQRPVGSAGNYYFLTEYNYSTEEKQDHECAIKYTLDEILSSCRWLRPYNRQYDNGYYIDSCDGGSIPETVDPCSITSGGGSEGTTTNCTITQSSGSCQDKTFDDEIVPILTGGGSVSCFSAGTKVIMADGSTKNIEDVNEGDEVLSYNTNMNVNEGNVVTQKFVHVNDVHEMYDLIINGEVLKVTDVHPFYVRKSDSSKGYDWIEAQYLKIGDVLMMIDGSLAKIEKINHYSNQETVYNLEVEGNHNYFVGKGYLVHNKNFSYQSCTPDGGLVSDQVCYKESTGHPTLAVAGCKGTRYELDDCICCNK